MKIFAYGFVWKSTKQLRPANKQRKILHLEHRILQVILHNLHQFLLVAGLGQYGTWSKWTSVTGNAWIFGWGKFLKSLCIVSRGALTLLFFEDPLYCLPGHPFIAYSVTSNPQPPLLFLLSCFFGWMGNHTTFDALFYLKIIWIYTCQSLVP